MEFINTLEKKASKLKGIIVLPEANLDKRVYDACVKILERDISKIIVFGKPGEFGEEFKNKNCEIIDIPNFEKLSVYANELYELRKEKGMDLETAKQLILRPDYFAMMLLKAGYADGVVAGAKWSTANTLRPALQIIRAKPGKSLVTGVMLMVKEGCEPKVFADVSLIENPTSDQLAEIAISSAEFYETITSEKAKVAMLSYSTKGSAKSEMVDKVSVASELAKIKSDYLIDGEMQADCALDKDTATKKGITSQVAGQANVLVFPDLNAGNIGYKLVARLGGYTAIGPVMLNFNKPVNDLSRGCTVDEIINTVVITKLLIN